MPNNNRQRVAMIKMTVGMAGHLMRKANEYYRKIMGDGLCGQCIEELRSQDNTDDFIIGVIDDLPEDDTINREILQDVAVFLRFIASVFLHHIENDDEYDIDINGNIDTINE